MENYGVLSLLPVAVVIVLVFLTKRTTVSLLAGTLVGAVMLYGVHFAKPWLEVVYGVMGSELWIWLVLVCGFFGSLVALFEASGGIYGFTDIAAKICKGEKRTLLAGWLLGIGKVPTSETFLRSCIKTVIHAPGFYESASRFY